MNSASPNSTTRREFLVNTGRLAAASALAGIALPQVHAAGTDTIQLALIGCGGRGTGAAGDALSSKNGPTKLVAMADVFERRLTTSFDALKEHFGEKVEVSGERKFIGFDAYQKAMDCLRPGDIAILATPPAFRWVHFTYALQKGLNVFMEKPVTVDGPTTRRMLALADESERKNQKVGVGLMIRHCQARKELKQRIDDGAIGDIALFRAYRMAAASGQAPPDRGGLNELLYQIRRFHAFLWSSGGIFSDYNIHQIDECCWMKGAFPVRAHATGGRQFRGESLDQNFDNYSVEYTFPDGTKFFFIGRAETGCHDEFASYAHGTKGSAIISTAGHHPGRCRLFKGQNFTRPDMVWACPQPEPSPYQLEWDDLLAAVRQDQKYNETRRGAIASLVTSMGRMAAHTGQVVTYEDILNCQHEFAPTVDKLAMNGPAPLQLGSNGEYPVPEPGFKKDREY